MHNNKTMNEQIKTPETKEAQTRVILEFMRHGKREYGLDAEGNFDIKKDMNPDLRLIPEGRQQAHNRGKEFNPQAEVAIGLGGRRVRSQETAYQAMLVNEDVGPDDTLEEIEEKIAKKLKVGKKMIIDNRLDFVDSGPIAADGKKAYIEKRYMSWIINDSDRSAIKENDTESTTYTRMAGNIAELVLRYTKVGSNFNRIASKTDKYEEFGNQLERYLGTHQGVVESFVAKALENKFGIEAKMEFVESVGGGFKETEGIHIEIINQGNEQRIELTYGINGQKETIELDKELLENIIEERREFDEKIKG